MAWDSSDIVREDPSLPLDQGHERELQSLTHMLVLTNLGEKMSEEEVDELLKAVDTSSGEINYTGKTGA